MTRLRRAWRGAAVVLAILMLLLVLLRAFVGDVYRITSSSMEPTISEGEYVLVVFDTSPPERFELTVLTRGGTALVKRVVGLPGEEVQLAPGGDLLIDGRRLPPQVPRPRPIPVFDSRVQDLAEHFRMGSSTGNPWTRQGAQWELDARELAAHDAAGLIGLRHGVHDGWLDREGRSVWPESGQDVGDLVVEAELAPIEPGGRLVLRLDEQGDVFRFAVELEPDAPQVGARATIARHAAGDVQGLEVLAEGRVPIAWGQTLVLEARNVDDQLAFRARDGRLDLRASYGRNRVHPRDDGGLGLCPGERVLIGGEGCRARLGRVRVWRDISYAPMGEFATRHPLRLGPGEVFLLGDNSRASSDGREWGPVPFSSLFGRARWVVWPPSAARHLGELE